MKYFIITLFFIHSLLLANNSESELNDTEVICTNAKAGRKIIQLPSNGRTISQKSFSEVEKKFIADDDFQEKKIIILDHGDENNKFLITDSEFYEVVDNYEQAIDKDKIKVLEKNINLKTIKNIKKEQSIEVGIPFIAKTRRSNRSLNHISSITVNDDKKPKKTYSTTHLQQKVHSYVNVPDVDEVKPWKNFKYVHQNYTKECEGCVQSNLKNDRNLRVQIEFNHDKMKVSKFDKYNSKITKKVGVNDFVIDTGYQPESVIGYAEIKYLLNVDEDALDQVIDEAVLDKKIFIKNANQLLINYFCIKKDPHNICPNKAPFKQICESWIWHNTHSVLRNIVLKLRRLNNAKIKKSRNKTSAVLASIARDLKYNQFVLHTFISALPQKEGGYSSYQVAGERFLPKQVIADPDI